MAESITILFVTIFLLGVCIVYVKWQHDKEFEKWFAEVIKQAPYMGFTQERINEFEEIFWYDYFCNDLTAEEAIKQYLEDN